jgi:molybdenum-dependent DNA-binding transcriptional regulator ModE
MTLRERASLATAVRIRRADERAATLLMLMRQGECMKRAAWKAGVSYRTARRYKRRGV